MTTLILDTDGGVDDAQALLMLLENGRVPDAITTVFGNVPLAQATDNILAVLAVAGADVPVHAGADRPLVQPPVHAQYIHGDDGLGGAPRPAVSARSIDSTSLRERFTPTYRNGSRSHGGERCPTHGSRTRSVSRERTRSAIVRPARFVVLTPSPT